MRPIAKSAKMQVKSTESSHIVNTIIRLYHNSVRGDMQTYIYFRYDL